MLCNNVAQMSAFVILVKVKATLFFVILYLARRIPLRLRSLFFQGELVKTAAHSCTPATKQNTHTKQLMKVGSSETLTRLNYNN